MSYRETIEQKKQVNGKGQMVIRQTSNPKGKEKSLHTMKREIPSGEEMRTLLNDLEKDDTKQFDVALRNVSFCTGRKTSSYT